MNLTVDFVDYFSFENLNVRPTNRRRIFEFIRNNKPELQKKYEKIYNKPQDNSYWDLLSVKINELSKQFDIECKIGFHHGGFKDNKPRNRIK